MGENKSEEQKSPADQKEPIKVLVVKESKFKKIKRAISWLISILLLVLLIWVAITIKNGLDDTMHVEVKQSEALCGSKEACLIIDGYYEDGFANWNIREYWPFFKLMIGTGGFAEGQKVRIICQADLKTDTFQHILTKLYFLYSKNKIKTCSVS